MISLAWRNTVWFDLIVIRPEISVLRARSDSDEVTKCSYETLISDGWSIYNISDRTVKNQFGFANERARRLRKLGETFSVKFQWNCLLFLYLNFHLNILEKSLICYPACWIFEKRLIQSLWVLYFFAKKNNIINLMVLVFYQKFTWIRSVYEGRYWMFTSVK